MHGMLNTIAILMHIAAEMSGVSAQITCRWQMENNIGNTLKTIIARTLEEGYEFCMVIRNYCKNNGLFTQWMIVSRFTDFSLHEVAGEFLVALCQPHLFIDCVRVTCGFTLWLANSSSSTQRNSGIIIKSGFMANVLFSFTILLHVQCC